MKYRQILIFLVISSLLLLISAGCITESDNTGGDGAQSPSAAAQAYARGEAEYAAADYRAAGESFAESCDLYIEAGDLDNAKIARDAVFVANRTVMEYSLNGSAARTVLRERVPGISDADITGWLDNHAQKILSENETLYFYGTASNYLYAHFEDIRKLSGGMLDFDHLARYALAGTEACDGPYVNPVHYTGVEELNISHDMLPATGTLQIWFPLPVGTGSQRDIVVSSLSYPEYIVKGPVTTGGIGYVYYEVPVDEVTGDLVIRADIAFTSYEQLFEIDPALVGEYDTGDAEYILYTSSERNIEITREVRAKALEIVGDETNPHLRAQKIYHFIIDTYPYSLVPHGSLDSREPKTAESTYMFHTGHGDCGTQSMLFSALCRSLGIPARAIGGYQMLLSDTPGSHFWAEYYLPGYGWVPNDPTVAEIADWVDITEADRTAFKEYYATNLDPARLVIQKNVDAPMDPPLPGDAVIFRLVRQQPAIVSDSAEYDIDLAGMERFTVSVAAVD
jgi:hypothetical protein